MLQGRKSESWQGTSARVSFHLLPFSGKLNKQWGVQKSELPSYFSFGFRNLSNHGCERLVSGKTLWLGIRSLCKHLVWILDFSDDKASRLGCFFHSREELSGLKRGFKIDVPNKSEWAPGPKQLPLDPPLPPTPTIQSPVRRQDLRQQWPETAASLASSRSPRFPYILPSPPLPSLFPPPSLLIPC